MVGSHSLNWPQVWKPHEYWDCRNISPHPVLDKFLGLQRNESLSIRQNGLVVLFPFYSDLYFKSLHLMHFEYRSKLFFIHKRLILKICAREQKGHFLCVYIWTKSHQNLRQELHLLSKPISDSCTHTHTCMHTHTPYIALLHLFLFTLLLHIRSIVLCTLWSIPQILLYLLGLVAHTCNLALKD